MFKRFPMWAYIAAVLAGGALFSGCGFLGLNQWTWLAILQEDLFG
jgi:hypothetical protein